MKGAAQKLFCLVRERDTGRAASDLSLVTHDSMQSVNCKALTFNGLWGDDAKQEAQVGDMILLKHGWHCHFQLVLHLLHCTEALQVDHSVKLCRQITLQYRQDCFAISCSVLQQHMLTKQPGWSLRVYSHIRSQHLDLLQHCCTVADCLVQVGPSGH